MFRNQNDDNRGIGGRAQVYGNNATTVQVETAPLDPLDDPRRMDVTAQERGWALAIRQAIKEDPELEPISDFWCVQLAILEHGNIEGALDRARHIQAFREEYRILDTAESGICSLVEFVTLLPGFHLTLSYCAELGTYVAVYDTTKFFTAKLAKKPENIPIWLSAYYYHATALNPDLEACRKGSSILMECEGFDWRVNIPSRDMSRLHREIAAFYPQKFQQIKCFNTGVLFNVMIAMVKKIMPMEFRTQFEFGCQTEIGRLDAVYGCPNLEAATERLLLRYRDSLRRRYANEASFTL